MSIKNASFSADEVALLFSLMNKPELGRSVLETTYGEIGETVIEEKMTTASHSLLARQHVRISEKDIIIVEENVESLLSPLVVFDGMIQFSLNENADEGPNITNIYLSKKDKFAAHVIDLGVVHKITSGSIDEMPELISGWVNLPDKYPPKIFEKLEKSDYSIKMAAFAELMSFSPKRGAEELEKLDIDSDIAMALAEDACRPKLRGSIVRVEYTSENPNEVNFDEAGAGLLYIVGKNAGWLLIFDSAVDDTVGRIIPGNKDNLDQQIRRITAS